MPGITFDAFDDDAPIGIGRVFGLLPSRARSLLWQADRSFEMVPSPSTPRGLVDLVYDLADEQAALPSDVIAQLTSADLQVIGGELRGFDRRTDQLEFIVRSVRGDEWDIEARYSEELEQIAARVPSWRPHPEPIL